MRSGSQLPSSYELSTLLTKNGGDGEPLGSDHLTFEKIPRKLLSESSCSCIAWIRKSQWKFPRCGRSFWGHWPQVCSHWSDVLYGTPGVRENVKIRDDVLDCEIPAVMSAFQEIIQRSAAQISLIIPRNNKPFGSLVIPCLNHLKALEATICKDPFTFCSNY